MTAAETLEMIAEEVRGCTRCKLHTTAIKAVPGEGPADARIMIIGEAPGFNEDRQGRPFVGAAGQFLNELLALAGLERTDVFIGNIIKHRPPNNRDPEADEIAACQPFLERQIAVINPPVILTLGRFAMNYFLPNERIMKVHGQARRFGDRLIVPMLHPAAALHQPQNRPLIEADFQRLPQILAQAEAERAGVDPAAANPPPADDGPEQLSMF
jgi:uracil-DNA glycosylase